jgi:hypothetical protein
MELSAHSIELLNDLSSHKLGKESALNMLEQITSVDNKEVREVLWQNFIYLTQNMQKNDFKPNHLTPLQKRMQSGGI